MNQYGPEKVVIELTRAEYNSLILALGYRLGDEVRHEEAWVFELILRVANIINRGNPEWTPYEEKAPAGLKWTDRKPQ